MNKRLPDKLSDLIDLAIDDCLVIEKNPRYELDMQTWHNACMDKCYVCIAGAVIANTLQRKDTETLTPFSFDIYTSQRIKALDWVRRGAISAALDCIGEDFDRPIQSSADTIGHMIKTNIDTFNGRADWIVYRQAANELRRMGL